MDDNQSGEVEPRPDKKRAFRRWVRAILKKRRLRDRPWLQKLDAHERARGEGMLADTPTPCSCWMCANPRKLYGNGHEGKTLRELSADEVPGLEQ